MMTVGIDPGLDGGIVAVEDDAVRSRHVMPTITVSRANGKTRREYDEMALVRIFSAYPAAHFVLERQQAMPGQGVASMFQIGLGYGTLRGVLAGLLKSYMVVTPQEWQKVMLAGLGAPAGGKQGGKASRGHAAVMCGRRWPSEDWRATERSRIPHDGLCDAALIATYGAMKWQGLERAVVRP